MKEMLNVKNPEIYAEMFLNGMPKNGKLILMYGPSDKRTMEIILDSYPKAKFVVADREANNRLLRHFYKGNKYKFINTTDDNNDLTLFDEEGEIGKMPKFDIAIMNPPYDTGLHLKILNKIKNISEIIINISPIQKYQEFYLFNDFKNADLKELASTHKIEFINYFNCDYACSFFGLKSLGSDVGIWKITKGNNNIENNLKKIVPNYNLVKKIYSKIENFDRLNDYLSDYADKYSIKFVYGLTLKNNGGHGFSAFSCTSRNKETAFENNGKTSHIRYVNATNQKNRENIWKVYTSKFMRFYFKQVILGNSNYNLIPWFDSFDMININKELCDIFKVTGYIDDDNAEPGSEWEIILNVMKEHD